MGKYTSYHGNPIFPMTILSSPRYNTNIWTATGNISGTGDAFTSNGGADGFVAHDMKASLDNSEDNYVPTSAEQHATFHGLVVPTEEEKATLRKVAGKMPYTCYLLCAVEFAERASYFGCYQVFKNFIRGKLPVGGNGAGAPPVGSELTAGALGKGSVTATAMTETFKFLAYGLCLYFGWLADVKYGRFGMICVGVAICGIAHVIMVISAIPSVLAAGNATAPFAISLYMLCIGAGKLYISTILETLLTRI